MTRFWTTTALGAPVRLSLTEGSTLSHGAGGATDEGYCYTYTSWWLEEGVVFERVETDSRDCDGRLTTSETYACPVDRLSERDGKPNWKLVQRGQRDFSAEAMGY